MDDFDRAQIINEDFQAAALHHQLHDREPANYTGEYCVDCEEPIPPERKKAMPGCRRCIDCQTTLENWRPL